MSNPTSTWEREQEYLLEAGAQSHKTVTTYRSGLRLFAKWLQENDKADYKQQTLPLQPNHLSTKMVIQFRNWMALNRSRATVTTYMAAVLGYLHFLEAQDELPTKVKFGKLLRQLSRRQVKYKQSKTVIDLDSARQGIPLIVDYYEQLPLPAKNAKYNRRLSQLRDRAIILVLYSTAARISEVTSLNRSDVKDGRAETTTIIGKGKKPRTVFLRDYARHAIGDYLAERHDTSPALFISHSRNTVNTRLTTTSVNNIIKRAVKALDLHNSISAHDFRHYRATQLLRKGMPLEVVQEYLGHADIVITRNIYAPILGSHVVGKWLDKLDTPPVNGKITFMCSIFDAQLHPQG